MLHVQKKVMIAVVPVNLIVLLVMVSLTFMRNTKKIRRISNEIVLYIEIEFHDSIMYSSLL